LPTPVGLVWKITNPNTTKACIHRPKEMHYNVNVRHFLAGTALFCRQSQQNPKFHVTVGENATGRYEAHCRQPRRGCRGHIPQYFGWGGTSTGISPNIITNFRIYWLSSVRSASSRFHSAIRRHQFASVRQAAHKARPPNLQLALTPLIGS